MTVAARAPAPPQHSGGPPASPSSGGISADGPDVARGAGAGVVRYGAFLTAVANFLLIGVTLFFVVRVAERFFRQEKEKEPAEIDLLTEIRDELRRRP